MDHTNKFSASVTIHGVTATYVKGEKVTLEKSLTKTNQNVQPKATTIVQPKVVPPHEPFHWGSFFGGFYLVAVLLALILYSVWWKWRKKDRRGADFMAILIPILVIAWIWDICKKKK